MTGTITYEDDDDNEVIGLTTIAEYNYSTAQTTLTYKEYPDGDLVDKKSDDYTINTITIHSEDKVTLTKSAKDGVTSILQLEKDIRHSCVYNTPFGSFEMGIFTTSLVIDANENECKISAVYTTDLDNENIRHHHLEISLKEKAE